MSGLGPEQHVVLVGAMGSGKTSVGRELAPLLGRQLRDNDVELEHDLGRTAAEVAAREGLPALHEQEATELAACLRDRPGRVVTAAASIADLPDAAALLSGQVVVWLDAPAELLWERSRGSRHRPDLGGVPAGSGPGATDRPDAAHAAFVQVANRRRHVYRRLADIAVDVSSERPASIARSLAERLTGPG